MRKSICVLLSVTLLALAGAALLAQQEDATAAATRQILIEIAEHSEQMQNLEHLTDRIGPRLTGSPALKRANEWTAERFRDYGLDNARLESWKIAHSWTRPLVRARVVAPVEQRLTAEAAGWSPDTPGPARGHLMYVKVEKKEDLEAFRGKLKGAIVMLSEPSPRQQVEEKPILPRPPRPDFDFAARQRLGRERDTFFKEEGVVAVLRDSNKGYGLFTMSSAGVNYQPAALPTLFLSPESYDLLWRLRQDDQRVELELTVSNGGFSEGEVEVYNTVAEIRGSEKPDEVVILGAHIDSWDLGSGATDNGTGVTVVLEAARALQKLNLKPKRTIRFVLFSGEEQGLHGSRAYVEAHKEEMEKISAVLIHDSGTGRVETISLNGNVQAYDTVWALLAPFRQMIGLEDFNMRSFGGSDHASFNRAGVPAFFCSQETSIYRQTHHSQADTFEKVVRDDVVNGAQVMAVFAYSAAQADEMLPRKPAPPQPPAQPSQP